MNTVEIKTRYICHPSSNNGIIRATYKGRARQLRYDQAVNAQANHYQAARRILDAVAGERFALVCLDLDGGRQGGNGGSYLFVRRYPARGVAVLFTPPRI